jgi:predicted XRE-type DNA-binding protein
MAAILTGDAGLPRGKSADAYLAEFHHFVDQLFQELPHDGKERLLNLLVKTVAVFSLDIELGRPTSHPFAKHGKTEGLTETSTVRNNAADMKSARTWKELLEQVQRLTKPRGMKAKLAAYLEVPQARVSEWMAGKHQPSGDMAVRLFAWVSKLQDRQSK